MTKKNKTAILYLLKGSNKTSVDSEIIYAKSRLLGSKEGAWIDIPLPQFHSFLVIPQNEKNSDTLSSIRKWAVKWADKAKESTCMSWELVDMEWHDKEAINALVEGFLISTHSFDKFKSDAKPTPTPIPEIIAVKSDFFSESDLTTAKELSKEINWVRDLVERPFSNLNAGDLAKEISVHSTELGIKAKVWAKKEIEKAYMGGLLGVNKGSIDEPSFTELIYKPENAKNKKPVVLVGKGVVFDAGGMNIKTGLYMDEMKTDMAGAAMAGGIIAMLAKLKVPLYVVALIPATDNRLNGNALVPGDIIHIGGKTTVEIVNTDAEGRLLLADAVYYAQKEYDPSCIISMATLTGAASRALGTKGIVAMQEGLTESMIKCLEQASENTQEKFWFFPMWKDYDKELKSDIADLKNCGSASAGMITAAKFVGYFSKSPFLHLDVAGVAYINKQEGFMKKGATAMGVRLMCSFLQLLAQQSK